MAQEAPELAAALSTVDLPAALDDFDPVLARQVREPRSFLLRPRDRLLEKTVDSAMQDLVGPERLGRFRGLSQDLHWVDGTSDVPKYGLKDSNGTQSFVPADGKLRKTPSAPPKKRRNGLTMVRQWHGAIIATSMQ